LEGDTQGAEEASTNESADNPPHDEQSTITSDDTQRLLLEESIPEFKAPPKTAPVHVKSTAHSSAEKTAQVLDDSDEATGVLAAVIMLAAEEMQRASANLTRYPLLHTPPATASLPEDIGRWSHVQLDRVPLILCLCLPDPLRHAGHLSVFAKSCTRLFLVSGTATVCTMFRQQGYKQHGVQATPLRCRSHTSWRCSTILAEQHWHDPLRLQHLVCCSALVAQQRLPPWPPI
jgi:hypothetical protein